jgi:hypothetical protein
MMLKWFKGFHFELQKIMMFREIIMLFHFQTMIYSASHCKYNLKSAKERAEVKILFQSFSKAYI